MNNTRTYFELAELSEATYADLKMYPELKEAVENEDFSARQATALASNWTVKAHRPNTDSGFSSTLFRNKDAEDGGFVLAIRGTKEFWNDLLLTDIAVGGQRVRLSPGMAVTAEIRTGQRRLMEFFLSPLLRYRQESVRER